MGYGFYATCHHLGLVFSGHRHFIGYQVDKPRIKHLHHALQARRHFQLENHSFVLGKAAHKVVVVAHCFLAVYEIGCGAVQGAYPQGVGKPVCVGFLIVGTGAAARYRYGDSTQRRRNYSVCGCVPHFNIQRCRTRSLLSGKSWEPPRLYRQSSPLCRSCGLSQLLFRRVRARGISPCGVPC